MQKEIGGTLKITLSSMVNASSKKTKRLCNSYREKLYGKKIVEEAYKCIGINIKWTGSGVKEKGIDSKTKKTLIKVDPIYYRPTDIDELRGDYSKARKELKWKPKTTLKN